MFRAFVDGDGGWWKEDGGLKGNPPYGCWFGVGCGEEGGVRGRVWPAVVLVGALGKVGDAARLDLGFRRGDEGRTGVTRVENEQIFLDTRG